MKNGTAAAATENNTPVVRKNEKDRLVTLINGVEKEHEHKSDAFRDLFDAGMPVGDIAAACGSHYSFVYGALKSAGKTIEGRSGESKSDVIRSMFDKGMTVGAISKELNSNYSFVHSVCKAYKKAKAAAEAAAQ